MISLVLGFLSSVVPKAFDLFSQAQDKKHELALMDRQLEIQKQIMEERGRQIQVQVESEMYQADSSAFEAAINAQTEAVKVDGVYDWVKSMNAAVRPMMGMCVVAFLLMGILSVWVPAVAVAFNALSGVAIIVELLMYIAGYFLGNRSFGKPVGKQ